jgi:hypothetical protein
MLVVALVLVLFFLFLIFMPITIVMVIPAFVPAIIVPLMTPAVAVVIPAVRERSIRGCQHSNTDNDGENPQHHRFFPRHVGRLLS